MKFRDFLKENKEKHAVLAFGRMNPPTTGHEVLVNKVKEVAKEHNASHHVVLSHSQDKAKNPLTAEQKLHHAKRFFPKTNLSVATKDEPNFLSQAAKLHKQGVTHLHMVAGSDRVPEYHKLLNKYNGKHEGALFNFKHIQVHSAGERDPDAEGTTGMSASKMRSHAAAGNFKEFKKGVPSHVPEHHAKELYNHVRQGMHIKESIDLNEEFNSFLIEGVHDKGIFKAIFLAGGPGSGKDYVLDKTLSGHGLTEINSDKALEYLMDKEKLDKTMPDEEEQKRDIIRGRAKSITELRQKLALYGRNGVIINGTGDSVEKITEIKTKLEKLGYDTSMLLIQTDDEVSKQRNIERGQRGGRTVPEKIRKEKWDAVQETRPEFAEMFGDRYVEFDNSYDSKEAPPEVVESKKQEMMQLYKNFQQFVKQPPQSEIAQQWVAQELQKKDTLPISKQGSEMTPHPDSGAADEARKLGLQYYGFGRYGKNGKVTHRSVHDKLISVSKKISNKSIEGRTAHKIGKETIHVKLNKEEIDIEFEELLSEVVGQGGRDYETDINTRLKKYGKARPDATTAGSSADAPDATFLHNDKEHNLEIKKDKGAMFGQMELHHNGKEWDASDKSKKKYPETYKSIKKSGFFDTLNKQWKKPSGDYENDLKMGNVYHNHPNADPIKAHYGKDRKTNYVQIGGGHGFYHTGDDVAGLGSPELHGQTQIRARMKPRGWKDGKRTYGALAVMSLKGDVAKSHHDLDKDPTNNKLNESYSLSDSSALNLLLLGNQIDEQDFDFYQEEDKKVRLMRDTKGRVRTFVLRRAAAKEAHQKNGEIMKYKNGYVIKLKEENNDVQVFESNLCETNTYENRGKTSFGWSNSQSNGSYATERINTSFITESKRSGNSTGAGSRNTRTDSCSNDTIQEKEESRPSKKITIAEVRSKQKEKIIESIDKGIEPGISMAAAGESPARDMGEKWKKKTGKSTQVAETIGAGGEDANSIGAKKEDELKKVGISLTTFKAKRPI